MALWPPFPFDPDETLLSFADRLSMFHTGHGMDRLLCDFGINRHHLVSGHDESVDCFAEAVGLSSHLLNQASVRVYQRGARFRGEAISKSFPSQKASRYCPACLREDGGQENYRFRLIWGFRHVSRCDRHDLWLMDAADEGQTNLRLGLADGALRMGQDADAEGLAYLTWLRDRLDGRKITEKTWMDGQTIEQVLDASEILGAILQHGHKVAITKLTPPETEEATDIGFSISSDGREAIEEALDTIRGGSSATAVQAGPLAQYGKLFDWLDRRCNGLDPGPIRDILRDHIIKHSAVEPGTRVLGFEVNERRYHSLYSLSATLGIERPRLSRILRKMEVIPEDATEKDSGNMVFEVDRTVPLVEAFTTAIPLRDVPDYLGATKRQIETLYREGHVQPLIPRNAPGSVRHVIFGRAHLNGSLEKISRLPEFPESSKSRLHPIAYASQRGAGRFDRLFEDVLKGSVPAFRHPERSGIGAIYVDVDSLICAKTAA